MLVSSLAKKINAIQLGEDVEFSRVSTDTRTLQPGDFFVALKGERFDGHEYVELARQSGAVAAMVSDKVDAELTLVQVADTRLGLGALGRIWAAQYSAKKVAITGSSGKTTVKEMVASICSLVGPTLFTEGNLNNDIGVPLTLCRLTNQHRFAIIELGANHVGEIAYASALVAADIALVNNVGVAHLEGFGSRERIAQAKSEIYATLAAGKSAVINLDDAFAEFLMQQAQHTHCTTYSMKGGSADVHLLDCHMNALGQYQFTASVLGSQVTVELQLIGRHNVANALAAMTIAHLAGCSPNDISKGLAQVKAVPGRLRVVEELSDCNVIDDTYNANPDSMHSAIDVLCSLPGETCLVLGGMAELGPEGRSLHQQVGRYAADKGIKTLFAVGEAASLYREGFLAGSPNGVFVTAQNHQRLAEDLYANHQDKTILIKGSRSAQMEKVIERMLGCQQAKRGNQ
ncbi:MAG TPA: UDP-N-acetylmuramoylalanyl-D-glutamyl-2, 6-diaminopimelate--D-alanyl-D-alanine ligase [Gammaproteobacteria bacterium]|nr:UDP-N-acetylmuramoylalanyl-D-glutamyl-2, 6-diaminopimelate--D-alanyl-D-alanine ligase [Gammaproteobacteria bacterium]